MNKFEITPNIGVGPIKFGMNRSSVEAVFGKPDNVSNSRIGFMSGFFIDFNINDKVKFIELSDSAEFEITYSGINLYKIKADDVVALLSIKDSYDSTDPELGYSYIFKSLQISLWRGTMPENEQDNDGMYFEAIGVANESYF